MDVIIDLVHRLDSRFSRVSSICDSIVQQISNPDKSNQLFMLLLADLKNELRIVEISIHGNNLIPLLGYLDTFNVHITPEELYILLFSNVKEYKNKAFKGDVNSVIETISSIKASISLWETRIFPSFNITQQPPMQLNVPIPPLPNDDKFEWNAFVCHATEDKDTFVRELCIRLEKEGLKIWYAEFSLKLGDSLRESIEKGLSNSRFGIVILSHAFIQKKWPQKELSALHARDSRNNNIILPVWLDLNQNDIASHFPLLADRFATKAQDGMDKVVSDIVAVLKQ